MVVLLLPLNPCGESTISATEEECKGCFFLGGCDGAASFSSRSNLRIEAVRTGWLSRLGALFFPGPVVRVQSSAAEAFGWDILRGGCYAAVANMVDMYMCDGNAFGWRGRAVGGVMPMLQICWSCRKARCAMISALVRRRCRWGNRSRSLRCCDARRWLWMLVVSRVA